jgi:hypothetical protein
MNNSELSPEKTLTYNLASELVGYDYDPDRFYVLQRKLSYTSRWTNCYRLVFSDTLLNPEEAWSFNYIAPKTEEIYIDEDDIFPSMKDDLVYCKQVFPVEKIVIDYE